MSVALVRLLVVASMFAATPASAQSGIRLLLWHFEGVTDYEPTGLFGLGFDRDLNDRLSMACEVVAAPDATVITMRYRSSFHFTPIDDGGTGYIGPMVAISSVELKNGHGIIVPIGARLGFRGTLPGTYMDVYAGYQVQVGANADNDVSLYQGSYPVAPFSLMFGINFGIGVSRGRNR